MRRIIEGTAAAYSDTEIVVVHTPLIRLALLAAHTSTLGQFWHKITDPTFKGIYHANGFDLAMMIPYFLVLFVLATYGLHRYWLVYDYYKYARNIPGPPPEVTRWPRVTVQLPIFNERYVIERLVEAVSRFDYPRELLDIQVLDDSTDETQQVASACVARFAAQGLPITYIHRANREGYKAGALENGLKTARGEFVAIFDADFIPAPDFLRRSIPYFQNEKIGMVQARWTYLNRDYSLLTQVETILLDGHFVVEHGARSRRGTFFNFNGTAGVWRRKAIEEAGGWEHDTLTEDTDLSYRAQLKGWKFLYLPDIECASELPVDINGFKAQQARWAKGLMQTAKKILPRVLISTMLLPAMIVRFYQGYFQMLCIDLPLFLASTCSISSFYLVAQKELRPKNWWRTFLYMPFVMAIGIGISVRNAQAVIEAIIGKKSEFARTPKYKIEGKQDSFATKKYRNKAGWMPYAEIILGVYFFFTVLYAVLNENYATVPFLLLFVWGYLYTGLMSLGQSYFAHLRFDVNAPEMRPASSGAPGF